MHQYDRQRERHLPPPAGRGRRRGHPHPVRGAPHGPGGVPRGRGLPRRQGLCPRGPVAEAQSGRVLQSERSRLAPRARRQQVQQGCSWERPPLLSRLRLTLGEQPQGGRPQERLGEHGGLVAHRADARVRPGGDYELRPARWPRACGQRPGAEGFPHASSTHCVDGGAARPRLRSRRRPLTSLVVGPPRARAHGQTVGPRPESWRH